MTSDALWFKKNKGRRWRIRQAEAGEFDAMPRRDKVKQMEADANVYADIAAYIKQHGGKLGCRVFQVEPGVRLRDPVLLPGNLSPVALTSMTEMQIEQLSPVPLRGL